jgi:hypothetical protein
MKSYEVIYQQLGGGRFRAMTGATLLHDGDNTLCVKFKGSRKANYMRVTLNGNDLYDMKFQKGFNVVAEFKDVYNDMLQSLFTKTTGLYTSL